jgi:hypothetical protein
VPVRALESLATLQQLTLEAGLSENLKQLTFRILNRSVCYCRYDRAVLWGLPDRRRLKLLGVSGQCQLNAQAPLVGEWRRVIRAMTCRGGARASRPQTPAILDPHMLPGQEASWSGLARRTRGLSVVWLPIAVRGRTVAGLWLERWGGQTFAASDLARLEALALAYGVAWRSVTREPHPLLSGILARKRLTLAAGLALAAAALCLIHVPLRIVAPCEVVPKDPVAITAPLGGVIEEVLVQPGRSVRAGELLAVYDRRVAVEELKVAAQQVQIIESDLQRSRVQAFDDPSARSAIGLLENRLEQERIRLRLAQHRVDQLEVRAPVGGTLMFSDPHEWRGRPVQVGERMMMIVDPQSTKLRIWLPEHDNISFDPDRPLNVLLHSDPRAGRRAALRLVDNHSQIGIDHRASFRAEAEWLGSQPDLKMGLQGTAVLYGREVPLGYWLLRRPLAAIRQFLGV